MNTATAEVLEVKVDTAQQFEERLDARRPEPAGLWPPAPVTHGILVTRLNPGHYTVSLSDTVPFGVTREQSR